MGRRVVGAHLVEPGTVLADRYVIEDLLAEEGASHSWRARDRVLARSVVLQMVRSSSPYAAELLSAAKRASRVADPRILQVLDAVDDGELSYVVREWATGQSLDVILGEGPLPSGRATWLLREVAAAMANAHRMGLPHRRLAPDTIVITRSSGVKVIGLGTFAALREDADQVDDPELADTRDLGRLLYACLTARWPGNGESDLPLAPTEHGRLLRPRQVRAGVSRPLDHLCDRILGDPPRYGEPITRVAEVKEELTQILADEGLPANPGVSLSGPLTAPTERAPEPPPALIAPETGEPLTGEQQPAWGVAGVPPPSADTPSPLGRTVMWSVLAVLIAGAMLLAFLIGQSGLDSDDEPPPEASSSETSARQPPQPVAIAGAQDFDPLPEGSGDENPEEVALAIDGDPATAWQTLRYDGDPALGGLKPGVGLVVDLGQVRAVRQVNVTLQGTGTSVELRAAPESVTSAPTDSADEYDVVGSVEGAGTNVEFPLQKPVRTQFLLVWLTSLPNESSDTYRGRIANIEVME